MVNDVSCKLMKFSVSHVRSYDIIHPSLRLSQFIKNIKGIYVIVENVIQHIIYLFGDKYCVTYQGLRSEVGHK